MNKGSFLKIHDVVRFIEDVFGSKQSFEIESGDAILRNDGRREEDSVTKSTFLEYDSSDLVFSVTIYDDAGFDTTQILPPVFNSPDYCKALRNRYREVNRTEIKYWHVDYQFSRLVEPSGHKHKMTFRFTVRYCGEI